MVVILLPASLLVLFIGGLFAWISPSLIGDSMQFATGVLLTDIVLGFCWLGVFGLWRLMLAEVSPKLSPSAHWERRFLLWAKIAAIVAVIAIVPGMVLIAVLIMNLEIPSGLELPVGMAAYFSAGTPLLIPYFHVQYLRKGRNSSV
jgi:hypothetical protein